MKDRLVQPTEVDRLKLALYNARSLIDSRKPVCYCTHCHKKFTRDKDCVRRFREHIADCPSHPAAAAFKARDEMMTALSNLCDWCEAVDADAYPHIADAVANARAAVAKAKREDE